jgi:hypothetical protein
VNLLLAVCGKSIQLAVVGSSITDSGVAIVLIAVAQLGSFSVIKPLLDAVTAVRHQRTGDLLQYEELNALAGAMSFPRQCGRCGFGPVDSTGCHDLRTHHGDVAVAADGNSSQISNACPRCGWFTSSLRNWPAWDGETQTTSGRSVFRARMWSEVVITVRASSKALVIPYSLLLAGSYFGLSPTLSGSLALTYIVPWFWHTATLAGSLDMAPVCPRTRGPSRHNRSRLGDDDGTECGAVRRADTAAPISSSQALHNILAASPYKVFLAPGDICAVCMDTFPDEASQAVGNKDKTSVQICTELRSLTPPIVALRCGHPLHVECAEAAVAASGNRHVRCPLCRESASLAGDNAAMLFS